jgi:hypothetical protein
MNEPLRDKDPAVEVDIPVFSGSLSLPGLQMLLKFFWRDRRYVVFTVCYALIVVATCFAISLLMD